jgi:polyisoprenyl-teichoic acid--peptidoglycan teichoic acid transferase
MKEGTTMENKNNRSNKHKTNKKQRNKRIIITVVFVLLAAASAVVGGIYFQLSKMQNTILPENKKELGINEDTEQRIEKEDPKNEIINIALFGIDRREKNEASRSDTMMIATIDKKHNKIKVSSLMRDTYVNVPGHGKTKLTHAYAYGGAPLAIKTLNENFQLNIKDYMTVDFFSMEKVIDTLGGIRLEIKQEEIPHMNFYIREMSGLENVTPKQISKPGVLDLTGMQAVAYTRVRYTANGDFERTERQRTVLNALFNKIQQAGVTKYPSLVSTILPYIETSIEKLDLLSMGTSVLTSGIKDLNQARFPLDSESKGQSIGGVYYLVADLKSTADHIHKFIYEDVNPNSK